ncbi:hypothetical protein Purlil1_9153 [Purpureocillium lilacinum]|uniref:Uncharacterized protein n=1 Tax=Purpureocillium lilacinum TaxID=33203 RepID=A0ABR0BR83_PURLI|nr:hypothetical protein Purlil1_9153 [Purpureocillium lilacinum]
MYMRREKGPVLPGAESRVAMGPVDARLCSPAPLLSTLMPGPTIPQLLPPSSAPCEAVPGGVGPPAPFAAITSGWGGSRQRSGARRGLGGQAWEGRGQLGVAIGESPRPCLVVAFPLESDVSLSLCGVPDPAWDGAPSSFGPNHDPPPLSTSRAKRASERQTEKQDAVAAAVAAGSLLEKRNKLSSWFDCPRALASSHRTAPRLACLDEPSIVGRDDVWAKAGG